MRVFRNGNYRQNSIRRNGKHIETLGKCKVEKERFYIDKKYD
jgi:hypothetical protein